ncbi:putative two-component system sensor kinase [Streptomyces lincolnensis]|uniref:histidine kinase n=1 Tax=Streptomyces lincolnensis TaxID=1915 RepID=A0A1B1MMB5_STRLN|nr:sensor histidine kinase [Streptomyces lincolnensis]ANS69677.1 putative two-component system sensor kinase [Streptomyces lincolnensis]
MTTDDLSGTGLLLARLGRIGRRLRQADRAHPWALDATVVGLVFLIFCLPDVVDGGAVDGDAPREFRVLFTGLPVAEILALQAGLVLPLLWRRRKPLMAFGAVAGVFVLQWSLQVALRADVALFITLYSLALHGRLRHLPWACGVAAGAMGLVAVRVSAAMPVWDALFFLLATTTAAVALGLMVRIRRAQLAGLRDRAARLEIERDQRSRLATATERTRVAREMHDIVGHNLAVIITLADAGAYAADIAPARGKETLLMIGDTGRQALSELRRVLGVLREESDGLKNEPELSPQPGIADIDALCAGIRTAGPEVVYRTSGDMDVLDSGVQLTVYRIVQEALTNTLKHAGAATRVDLEIAAQDTQLTLRVRDTGSSGPTGPPNEEGHGLVGMRERAALYRGTVSAGPVPGGGWSVEATLDLTPRGSAG